MAVVTISRQMGSQGFLIAQEVARSLGYRLVWRDLINHAAIQSGSPEVALAAIDELGLFNVCPSPKACHAYRQAVQNIMENMAREGNIVIIGRAGQVILAGWPQVLHVRIFAPLSLRIERVAVRQSISCEAALAQIEASDRFRTGYLRRFYHTRWNDPDVYDLIVNTARLTTDEAIGAIAQATRLVELRQTNLAQVHQETALGSPEYNS